MTPLSPRELQIAAMCAIPLCLKEMVYDLNLSDKTVKGHLYRIFRKCEVGGGRMECVLKLIRTGILPLDKEELWKIARGEKAET
jgi:DNA-binding NarL/FixJ family response regulator